MELFPGIATLFLIVEVKKRSQIILASVFVFVFYLVLFLVVKVSHEESFVLFQKKFYLAFLISSLLILTVYPLIFITEKLFGFISDFTLIELCDLNQPLLRKISAEIPGTFQHSLQVANLAEEAVFYVGGNSLLIRAGAMYHDIGKLKDPNFFIENQIPNSNPHENIGPKESARIIIGHVINGIEIAKENNLPEDDFKKKLKTL